MSATDPSAAGAYPARGTHPASGGGTRRDPLRPLRSAGPRAIVSAAIIVVVIAFGFFAAHSTAWVDVETPMLHWFAAHRVPGLTVIATTIAWLFSPLVAAGLTAIAAAVVGLITRNLLRAVTFLLIVGVNSAVAQLIKSIVRRPRPGLTLGDHAFASAQSFSYPSGHTCFAAALGIAVIFVLRDARARWVAVTVASVITVATALSRVYLGVHYLSDVVASMIYTPAAVLLVLALWLNVVLPRWATGEDGGDAEDGRHAGA